MILQQKRRKQKLIVGVHVAVSANRSELFAFLIFTELDLGEHSWASPPCLVFFVFLLLLTDAVFFSISQTRRLQLTPTLCLLIAAVTETEIKERWKDVL